MSRVADRIVGTWGPRSVADLVARFESPAAARCGLLELRLDLLPGVGSHGADAHLEELIAAAPRPVIATCRPTREGGRWTGDEAPRLELLGRAAELGAAWIDVEGDVPVADVPRGAQVLRSTHVDRLPEDVSALVERLLEGGDAAKVVARHGSEREVLCLLEQVRARVGRLAGHVIEQPFSRYASALLGAPFVYAALASDDGLGVALPTVAELLDRAALARATTATRAWVLLGGDVRASASPQMLNAAFAEQGADVVALRWSCADPEPALDALTRFGWAGAAVTIPHKETVRRLLAERGASFGEEATATGAVNTVIVRDGVLAGHNTDVGGLLDALEESGLERQSVAGRTAVVVGAGGAARAAIRVVLALGATPLVVARRPEAAEALRDLGAVPSTYAGAAATDPRLLIDATPVGPPGGNAVVDPSAIAPGATIADLLVAPSPTAIEVEGLAAGHEPMFGLRMLVHQARRQVELVTGERPPKGPLYAAGRVALGPWTRNVVLLGLRGAGKSTIGRRLAERLGRRFVDLDDEVTRAAGRTPDEMIRVGEEPAFREHERRAILASAKRTGCVVATGGGAALAGHTLDALATTSFCVLLDAPDDVLLARLASAPRAALGGGTPAEELAHQRAERMPTYLDCAVHETDTSAPGGVDAAVEDILRWLRDHPAA